MPSIAFGILYPDIGIAGPSGFETCRLGRLSWTPGLAGCDYFYNSCYDNLDAILRKVGLRYGIVIVFVLGMLGHVLASD